MGRYVNGKASARYSAFNFLRKRLQERYRIVKRCEFNFQNLCNAIRTDVSFFETLRDDQKEVLKSANDLNNLDGKLIHILLCRSPFKDKVYLALLQLVEQRNKYFAHVGVLQISNDNYQRQLSTTRSILDDLGMDMTIVDNYMSTELTTDMLRDIEQNFHVIREELEDLSSRPDSRLKLWMDKFSPGYTDGSIANLWEHSSLPPPLILGRHRVEPNTRSMSSSRHFSVAGRHRRDMRKGELKLLIHPERVETHCIPTEVEVVVGCRGAAGSDSSLVIHPEDGPLDPNKCNQERWLIGLERDSGLHPEHLRFFYNPLVPGWQVSVLHEITVYITRGEREEKVKVGKNDFVLIFEEDKIHFGRSYYHHIVVQTCRVNEDDQRNERMFSSRRLREKHHLELVGKTVIVQGGKSIILPETRGGFSIIYKAQNIDTKEYYAVKMALRKEHEDRLIKELDILLSLAENPYVIRPHDMMKIAIVLPWAKLGTLKDCLESNCFLRVHAEVRSRPLFLTLADIFLQVTAGIKYAHEKGVIHRDLNAANILVLSRDGMQESLRDVYFSVSICDFNSSSGVSVASEQFFNLNGATRSSMAPEQMRLGGIVTSSTDIWNLGLLLLRLLSLNQWCSPPNSDILRNSITLASIEPPQFAWIDTELLVQVMNILIHRCLCLDAKIRPSAVHLEATMKEIFCNGGIELPRLELSLDERNRLGRTGRRRIINFLKDVKQNSALVEKVLVEDIEEDRNVTTLLSYAQFLRRQCPVRLPELKKICNEILTKQESDDATRAEVQELVGCFNYEAMYGIVSDSLRRDVFDAELCFKMVQFFSFMAVDQLSLIQRDGVRYTLNGPHYNKYAEHSCDVVIFSTFVEAVDYIRNRSGMAITMSTSQSYSIRNLNVLVDSPSAEITWVLVKSPETIPHATLEQRLRSSESIAYAAMLDDLRGMLTNMFQRTSFWEGYFEHRSIYKGCANDMHVILGSYSDAPEKFQYFLDFCGEDHLRTLLSGVDDKNNTPLHLLLKNRSLKMLQEDKSDHAIRALNDFIIRVVTACPEALEVQNNDADFPLHIYVRLKHASVAVVQVMLDGNPGALHAEAFGGWPFQMALRYGVSLDVLKFLKSKGEDIELRVGRRGPTAGEAIALMSRSLSHSVSHIVAVTELAVEWRIPFHVTNYQHKGYPLHLASERAPFRALELILEAYPDAITDTDEWYNTPLHRALKYHNERRCCEMLLDRTPNYVLRQTEFEDLLPIHCYLDRSHVGRSFFRSGEFVVDLSILRSLIACYPDGDEYAAEMKGCNVFDKMGNLALHTAVRSNVSSDVIDILLEENPAALYIENDDCQRPFSQKGAEGNLDYSKYIELSESEPRFVVNAPVSIRMLSISSEIEQEIKVDGPAGIPRDSVRTYFDNTPKVDWMTISQQPTAPLLEHQSST